MKDKELVKQRDEFVKKLWLVVSRKQWRLKSMIEVPKGIEDQSVVAQEAK